MKDFIKKLEQSRKENKEIIKKNIPKIEKLLEDSSTAIVMTDKGTSIIGHNVDVKASLSAFIHEMIKNKVFTAEELREILELGIEPISGVTSGLEKMLDKIKNLIGE